LKIALDASYSIGQHLSGVGVYSREILFGLAAGHPETGFRFCYRPHKVLRSFHDQFPPNARRRLIHDLAPAIKGDVFHFLNQRVAKHRCRYTICTFHDLFVMTGDYSSPDFRARFTEQAKHAAAASDLIVTVSRFTADQVSALLGIPSSRIRVIHHGVRVPSSTADSIRREPLILFVGAIQRRKNIGRLVEAFENTAPGWRLVLAGGLGFGAQEIVERVERSTRHADIELSGYVTPEALELLYRRASIFAFPSLDEGFGMPILDAMAREIPVLTSNRSAMPEVAGDAALLVDPDDTEALQEGLRVLTLDETLRNELATRGFSRSLKFTWESALQQTWGVYRELTGFQ